MSDLVWHYDFPLPLRCRVTSDTFFCCVCAPAPLSEPVRRFSSCSMNFSQQIAQVVLCFSAGMRLAEKLDWKGLNWLQNVCFDFLYNFCLKYFSFQEEMSEIWSKMHAGLHVKYPLFWYDFNETWILTDCKMYVLISSTTFVWNISHSKKKWARYDQKRILVFM